MPLTKERYRAAVAAIDAANAEDPNTLVGSSEPLALAQGVAATRWARRLAIHPSEELLLAARAHHLRRWEVPRATYPEGRTGYLKWRADRKDAHARDAAEILDQAGYEATEIDRVGSILQKRRLKSDSEVQLFEDVVTLVFLETQLDETVEQLGDKALDVLTKTLRKMSPSGIATIPEVPGIDEELFAEALEAAGRSELNGDGPMTWHHPLGQAQRLIRLGLARAKDPVVTISGQLGGLVLLHLIREEDPGVRVVFVDTGYHFGESLEFIERLGREWNLDLEIARTKETVEEHEAQRGQLYITDPQECCYIRKVLPAEEAVANHDVWFTALRAEQTAVRAGLDSVAGSVLSTGRQIVKVNPLLRWTWAEVEACADKHDVPRHPLYEKGYSSIGCGPCTTPTFGTSDDRSGRWQGVVVECGLHLGRRQEPQ